jgi:hypothetical protein
MANTVGPVAGTAIIRGEGISGGGSGLTVANSIVFGNSGSTGDDLVWRDGNLDVAFSDLCQGSAPWPGSGNLCVDPAVPSAGDAEVHLTSSSPVIDQGSNALVPPDLAFDYDPDDPLAAPAQARIAHGGLAGNVDMGADEVQRSADISIAKSGTPATVKVGEEVTWTVTVTNKGPDPAAAVAVTDHGIVTELGTLAAGASKTVTFKERPGQAGTRTNVATVTSPTPDPTPGDHRATASVRVEALPAAPPKLEVLPASAIRFPSTRRCVSRRAFRIRLRKLKGVVYKSAVVTLNGKALPTVRGRRLTSGIVLKGLPKGRWTVKIVATTTDGRTISGKRKYRTCTKKRKRRFRAPV